MGGVLFIDEAYYLYRPENERDYGQEAIEILLQVMENQRDDLVVILAGYKDRMEAFFRCNPGLSSRIAHHFDFRTMSRGNWRRSRSACCGKCSTASAPQGRRPPRLYPAAHVPASFCERALDPQCLGSGAAASGEPPVRAEGTPADAR